MTTFTICLDEETLSRLSAAAAACQTTRGHVAREVLRATFGVHPLGRVFGPPSAGFAPNRDAPWLNGQAANDP
jgi:hypothetical protein